MNSDALIIIGEVVLVPVLTFLTMWVKNYNEKEIRRDNRDDNFIKTLEDRITVLEKRLDAKETEIREIRHELKNRDAEYVAIYQDYTTLKAKYEVLQHDHDDLKAMYDTTANELSSLKETIKKDREHTANLAASTADKVAI